MELDAKVIAEMLYNADSSNKKLSPLLLDCKFLMPSLTQVRIAHVFREMNRCADYLTKNGCYMREDFVIFYVSPSNELDGLLVFDRNGLYSYRQVASTLLWPLWPVCSFFCCLILCLLTKKKLGKSKYTKINFGHE